MVVKTRPVSTRLDIVAPKTQPDHIQTAVVEDRRVALHGLLPYVDGKNWTVTYFKSVLGADNNIRDLDTEESAVFQQYDRINQMDIKVTSDLSHSFDQEKGTSSVDGAALIYPFMIPNVGDYFTANVDANDLALLRIYAVERKSHRNQSVWEVRYRVVGYRSTPEISASMADLLKKCVTEYWFNKDRLVRGVNPLLSTKDQESVVKLDKAVHTLCDYYISTFFNQSCFTLTLPSMPESHYEHGLVDFFLAIVQPTDHPDRAKIKQLSHCNDVYILQPTIWTALLKRNIEILDGCNDHFGRVSTKNFSTNYYFQELYFSAVEYVMYPYNPDLSVNMVGQKAKDSVLDTIYVGTGFKGSNQDLQDLMYDSGTATTQLFPRVLVDDWHVFTEGFYKRDPNLTVIESETLKYLQGEALDTDAVKAMVSKFYKLNRLDQFYFGPILILLVKVALDEEY